MSRKYQLQQQFVEITATWIEKLLPDSIKQHLIKRIALHNPNIVLQGLGPLQNHIHAMDDLEFVFSPNPPFQFDQFIGLFSSNALNSHIAALTLREGVLLFALPAQLDAKRIVEIGRYKGGSLLLLAAGMQGAGDIWSIDIGKKEARLQDQTRSYDVQSKERFEQLGLTNIHMLIGDSRTIKIKDMDGEIDILFIDGDHSYEGVKADFENFRDQIRMGGAVLFHDAVAEPFSKVGHMDTVGRFVSELLATGDYKHVRDVDRIAYLERVR